MILIPQYRTARRSAASGLPLDNYTTNLWAAWSTRKLLTAYAGNSMNLNRLSDASAQTVGFVNNILDTATVATFGSGTTAYPVAVYDQSGNSRPSGAGSTAPVIYDGTGQRYINSMPALYFDTATDLLAIASKAPAMTLICTVFTDSSNTVLFSPATNAADFIGAAENGSAAASSSGSGTVVTYVDGAAIGATRDNLYDAAFGGFLHVIAFTTTSTSSWSSNINFCGYTAGYGALGLSVVDVVMYSAVLSAGDIAAISSKLIAGI